MVIQSKPQTVTVPEQTGVKVRRIPDWEAAGLAGILAGVVFMALEMILTPLSGRGSPWSAPRFIVDVVFDGTIGAPSVPFIVGLGLFVHFTLSLIYSRLLVILMLFRHEREAVPIGAGFGILLYFFNFYAIGAALPRLEAGASWIWLVCHVVFGIVAAVGYKRLEMPAYE